MEITEVRIILHQERKLKGFANVTFDDMFVVRGIKIIEGSKGFFISMPSRKRPDGTYHDVAHPVNNDARRLLESTILAAYEEELKSHSEVY
ncbi:MAG: hypothetical protein DRP46_09790 [Candidatus Zixiibacteriota bacterium]|nr:MAG: hypothetical protein DRP46_09790 [candidate division Zixibacteria bacterium]